MDINKIIEISNNVNDKSNKDLISARDILIEEFDKTKDLIINLTKHLEGVEEMYDKINNEIKKRIIK
jgi:hypothetical protein